MMKKSALVYICYVLMGLMGLNCDQKPEGSAAQFDRIARTLFKEVYPAIAEEIVERYHIDQGMCYDLGCGPGYLSIELARRSHLQIIGVDIDSEAVALGNRNVKKVGLADRIRIDHGNVETMSYKSETADLIVSRGSIFFWEDRVKGLKEAYRLLKPGAVAYIGGGMGRKMASEDKAKIKEQLKNEGFFPGGKVKVTPFMMEEDLISAGIRHYQILGDGPGDSGCKCGMWVEIKKPNVI